MLFRLPSVLCKPVVVQPVVVGLGRTFKVYTSDIIKMFLEQYRVYVNGEACVLLLPFKLRYQYYDFEISN